MVTSIVVTRDERSGMQIRHLKLPMAYFCPIEIESIPNLPKLKRILHVIAVLAGTTSAAMVPEVVMRPMNRKCQSNEGAGLNIPADVHLASPASSVVTWPRYDDHS